MSKDDIRPIPDDDHIGADDPFYNINNTASANECTGLVPAAIENDEEADAYGELYAIHPPKSVQPGEQGNHHK